MKAKIDLETESISKKQKTDKISSGDLYDIKNAENLYQSNFFKLQLEEIVKEVSISNNDTDKFNRLVNELIKSLKSLKPVANIKFSDLKRFESKNIAVPLSELSKKLEGAYSFFTPTSVNLIGGLLTNTLVKSSKATVDLSVEMPLEYFNERDYLNYRYFIKRSLYMANVIIQLMEEQKYSKLKFEFIANYSSSFKPLLLLTFIELGLEICLHFVPHKESFKYQRFNPIQNNVRREWFLKSFNYDVNHLDGSQENDITPFYNYEILSDVVVQENNQFLRNSLNTKGLTEGIQLLKLWFIKRKLNQGFGGFDSFTLNMFVAYLLKNGHINSLMSSYQIFRITLFQLSEANWHTKGISLKNSDSEKDEKDLSIVDFHKFYEVVFVDPSGFLNITSKLNKNTFLRVKHEANNTIQLLKNELFDSFETLFIHDHPMEIRFDALIKINPNSDNFFYQEIVKKTTSHIKLLDFLNNHFCVASKVIIDLLNKSLQERTNLIFAELIPNMKWAINSKPAEILPSIVIGILFNDKFDNPLIKGPSSLAPEAAEFRKFWGPKSELRRFQDTTICETVLFDLPNNVSNKRLVYSEIVKHILELHLSINQSNLKFCDHQLNTILSLPKGIVDHYGTGEERLADACVIFEEFAKILKNMKDLPLLINSVQGVSSVFRQTDVFAPLPCCFKYDANSEKNMQFKLDHKYVPKYPLGPVMIPYVKPLEIVCQLESSGKWPDDLKCIKRLKAAFYLQIVQLLRENHGLCAFTNVNYCDVVFKGFVFRLHICTISELLCMKSETNEQGIIIIRDTKKSLSYEKKMFHIPKINSALYGLQQKFSCFSGVCRLVKRWLASNLLIEFFEEETIDLICSYFFVQQISYEPPRSIITGFLRFLDLFANFDWKNKFLLVNFNNELTKDQVMTIQLKFQEMRSNFPAIFIITPYDVNNKNSPCTWSKPNIQQLFRAVVLAKDSLMRLKININNFDSSEHFKNIFRPNLDMYDVVISLKPSFCVKAYQSIDVCEGTFLPHYRNYDPLQKEKILPVIDFDPVMHYVDELRNMYGELAMFFYDTFGGSKIYVLWKPDSLKGKDLKHFNAKYRMIDQNKNELILNIEAIIKDFEIIGEELVEKVLIKNECLIFK